MSHKMIIAFQGRSKKRNAFLDQITGPIDRLAEGRIHVNSALMFFREILKNIYDHADGMGRMTLEETERGIRFEIEDFGTDAHDFEALKSGGSSKAGNGVNYGVGLGLIQGMAADLRIIDFKINCSRGFKYSGVYPYGR